MAFTNETATTIIDSGHTAWILVSMALVLLVSSKQIWFYVMLFFFFIQLIFFYHPVYHPPQMMPGLAFLYAGLLHKRSAVTMIMQNFASVGVIFILVRYFPC